MTLQLWRRNTWHLVMKKVHVNGVFMRKLPSQQLHLLVSQAVFPLKETKEWDQAPGKAELRELSKAVC